jgi:Domain of unknown function (DUF4388)
MTFAGYLSEYSLAEVFNFVHEGNRTGLLSITVDPYVATSPTDPYYLWFESGRIVAVTSGLDGRGLLMTIGQRKFMSPAQIELVGTQFNQLPPPLGQYLQSRTFLDLQLAGTELAKLAQPLGFYLKSCGLLDAEQLKLLFNAQTLTIICKLFELNHRQFRFDPDKLPLNTEMTGLSLPAQEAALLGLRFLKDWSGLSAKLPDPNDAIAKCAEQQPSVRLDRHELQLWKLADGKTPLTQLAVKMDVSIEVARQISFRLSSFRSIQVVHLQPLQPLKLDLDIPVLPAESTVSPLSTNFLGNLKKFLKIGREKSLTK